MKDKRHSTRIALTQELYAHFFNQKTKLSQKSQTILDHIDIFNKSIEQSADKYGVAKIAKIDLAILYGALYELLIEKKQPPKVVINEAIELAKELGSEKSPGFINAVLSKIYQNTL